MGGTLWWTPPKDAAAPSTSRFRWCRRRACRRHHNPTPRPKAFRRERPCPFRLGSHLLFHLFRGFLHLLGCLVRRALMLPRQHLAVAGIDDHLVDAALAGHLYVEGVDEAATLLLELAFSDLGM